MSLNASANYNRDVHTEDTFQGINSILKEILANRFQSVGLLCVFEPIYETVRVCTISSFECISISETGYPICIIKLGEKSLSLAQLLTSGRASFHFLTTKQKHLAIEYAKARYIQPEELNISFVGGAVAIPDVYCSFQLKVIQHLKIGISSIVLSEIRNTSPINPYQHILQYRNRKYVEMEIN